MSEAEVSRSTWQFARPEDDDQPSLREVNSSIAVPSSGAWFRRLFAFLGPGYMVSVGYMDPGNWATDLAGGAQFGYNYQTGPWVVGVEGDFSFTNVRGGTTSTLVAPNVGLSSRINWVGTVTGRLGYTWGPGLLYVKGGVAFRDDSGLGVTAGFAPAVTDRESTGWTVGGGLEYFVNKNFGIRVMEGLGLGTDPVSFALISRLSLTLYI